MNPTPSEVLALAMALAEQHRLSAAWGIREVETREALRLFLSQHLRAPGEDEDAARYRWLRQPPNNINASVYGPTGGLLRRDAYLDAAIDASRTTKPEA